MTVNVHIDSKLKETYPSIRLGIVSFEAKITPSRDDFWNMFDQSVVPDIKKRIEGKSWSQIPGIRGSRAAYKAFGRDPGRYRVSSEALLRRVRRGDELYHVNSVVDVNNLISVESGLSAGSYDTDHIEGDIILRTGKDGEGYQGIGKKYLDMSDMLVLADDEGIFGSSMSDSERTMVSENTSHVLVVVYCFENEIDLIKIVSEAEKAFIKYADAANVKGWTV